MGIHYQQNSRFRQPDATSPHAKAQRKERKEEKENDAVFFASFLLKLCVFA